MNKLNTSIKKLINEEKNQISNEMLFKSSKYKQYLQKIVNSILSQNKKSININVETSFGSGLSFTDNKIIHIDTGNTNSMSFPLRTLKSESIIGILGHELGHVLYTDFNELNTYLDSLENGVLYPTINNTNAYDEELQNNLNEILQLLSDKNKVAIKVLSKIGSTISNILEDLYVNTLICKNYPGSFKKGILMNNVRAFEKSLSIQNQIDNGFKEITIVLNILISYVILGKINNLGNYEGEYLNFLDECIPIIDNSVLSSHANLRFQATNEIIVRAFNWIKPLIDEVEDNDTAIEEFFTELDEQIEKISISPKGEGKKANNNEPLKSDDKITENQYEEIKDYIINLEITNEINSKGTGSVKYNSGYESSYNKSSKELEKLINEMSFDNAANTVETNLSKELQEYSNQIRYGDAHKNVNVVINRKVNISERMEEDYIAISQKLIPLSKRLQQQILPILKENKNTKVLRHQICGRRIDMRSVMQDDNKYFSNKQLPKEIDMVIGILIDESGSMESYGRIEMSKLTAILLEDFCRNLSIPIVIYGHTDVSSSVELFSYVEFDSIDNKDKYRLLDIGARSSNRDGCAIRYVCERLLTRNEEIKLMIVISDGQPYAYGYYGTEAEADIRGIKREYENKGISMFAAAIGDDKSNIERIYKNGFLDITNLEDLPKKLAVLITKHIKCN